ncbi:MAG: hypothetical protein KF733_03320 [Fimbriimonadaceae bacterium]|nr:MAG: hypothetical protein KF733_03320 [Fimbriimonadaceae bacterium]
MTALFVGCLLGAWLLRPKPGLSDTAVRAVEAARAGEADTLFDLAEPNEMKALGMTKEKFRIFFAGFLSDQMKGAAPQGKPKFLPNDGRTQVNVSNLVTLQDGRKTAIELDVVSGPDGPLLPGLVKALVLTRFMADWPAEKPLPRGVERLRWYRNRVATHKAELESLGVPGFPEPDPVAIDKVDIVTWNEQLRRYDEKLAQAQN